MKAFIVPFTGWLVRAGPDAEQFGDIYLYTCPAELRDGVPTLIAYPTRSPTAEALEAAAQAFAREGYREIHFERFGDRPHLTRLTFEANGEISMKHEKIRAPHVREVPRGPNNKPDWATVKATNEKMVEQIDAGHYTIDDGGQVDSANNSHDDEKALMKAMRGLKPNQRLLWFVRGETDTKAPAA